MTTYDIPALKRNLALATKSHNDACDLYAALAELSVRQPNNGHIEQALERAESLVVETDDDMLDALQQVIDAGIDIEDDDTFAA
jgi:hypothetical protein